MCACSVGAGATLLVCQVEEKDSSDSEMRSEASASEPVSDGAEQSESVPH